MSRPALTVRLWPTSTVEPYWVTVSLWCSPLAVDDLFGRDKVDVTTGIDRGVGPAFQHTAGAVEVLPCLDGQVIRRFNTGGAVDEVSALADVARTTFMGGDAAFVDHIAAGGGECDVTTGDNAAGLVDEVVPRQQVEAIAGLYQAAVDQIIAGGGG